MSARPRAPGASRLATRLGANPGELLERIGEDSIALKEYVGSSVAFGLKTGLNDAFIVDSAQRARLVSFDAKCDEKLPKILFGRDIRRCTTEGPARYVIYLTDDDRLDDYPSLREHLLEYRRHRYPREPARKNGTPCSNRRWSFARAINRKSYIRLSHPSAGSPLMPRVT